MTLFIIWLQSWQYYVYDKLDKLLLIKFPPILVVVFIDCETCNLIAGILAYFSKECPNQSGMLQEGSEKGAKRQTM